MSPEYPNSKCSKFKTFTFWLLGFWVLILFRVSDLGFRISLYPFLFASIYVVTCDSVTHIGYTPRACAKSAGETRRESILVLPFLSGLLRSTLATKRRCRHSCSDRSRAGTLWGFDSTSGEHPQSGKNSVRLARSSSSAALAMISRS